MNKKWAITVVVGVIALIYLLILVGIPALANMIPPCGSCGNETANITTSNITKDWIFVGPPREIDTRSAGEKYKAPLLVYFTPGLVGVAWVVVILKQKKEVK